jgi:hypothetical protein
LSSQRKISIAMSNSFSVLYKADYQLAIVLHDLVTELEKQGQVISTITVSGRLRFISVEIDTSSPPIDRASIKAFPWTDI